MKLTTRQSEVLRLLCNGLENKHIAARLAIGESTVESHRKRVMRASKSGNAVQLGVWAAKAGLV